MYTANSTLMMLYDLIRHRFVDSNGNVYDQFLVKNSSEETRYEWVKLINGSNFSEKDGPFKAYIDGLCEIDEIFEKLEKDFRAKSEKMYETMEAAREGYLLQTYTKIRGEAGILNGKDIFSEKKIAESLEALDEIIAAQDLQTSEGPFFAFYCQEFKSAFLTGNEEKFKDLMADYKLQKDYIWKKVFIEAKSREEICKDEQQLALEKNKAISASGWWLIWSFNLCDKPGNRPGCLHGLKIS